MKNDTATMRSFARAFLASNEVFSLNVFFEIRPDTPALKAKEAQKDLDSHKGEFNPE